MAAPRPDVKVYLDADVHAALKIFADHEGQTQGGLAEAVLTDWLRKRVHDATVLASSLERAGITREGQESAGSLTRAQGNGRK